MLLLLYDSLNLVVIGFHFWAVGSSEETKSENRLVLTALTLASGQVFQYQVHNSNGSHCCCLELTEITGLDIDGRIRMGGHCRTGQ